MSELLKRAIERQNRAWEAMKEIRATAEREERNWSAEERAKWDAADKDVAEASEDINRLEREARYDAIDRSKRAEPSEHPAEGGDDAQKRYAEAFGAYMRRGMGRLNAEQRDLLEAQHTEIRAASSLVDGMGGYLVPEGYRNTMTETLKAYGGLLRHVEVINTDTGNDLPWVTNDDTGNEGEILGENQQAGEQDLAYGGRKLKAFIFSSKVVKVPLTLMQDSAFDLNSFVPRKQGERIGRRAARAWTTGTGVDEPEGITMNLPVGRTGANGQTTSIVYSDLLDVEHSVDPAYRLRGMYLLHDLLLKSIRKLTDTQQRPLWVPVPSPGFPATINGYPYEVDNSMPTPAANAKSLVFGDLRAAYVVRMVQQIANLRLAERYAEFLQVGFLGFARMDGMVQDSSAARTYQHSAV